MNETALRIVVARNPPDAFDNCSHFPTWEPKLKCPFPGWTAEVVNMLAADLKLKIEAVVMNSRLGQTDTGSLVNVVYISKRRPISLTDGLWNILVPFTWDLWIAILVAFLIQAVFGWIFRKMEHKFFLRDESSFLETIWDYFRVHLLQLECKEYFFSTSGNFSFFMFNLLQSSMFTALYTGILLTGLLTSNSKPFSSLENMVQLIAQGEYTMVTHRMAYKSNWYYSDLENSNEIHFKQLREALKENPIIIKDTLNEALELVQEGSYIYASQQDSSTIQLLTNSCGLYYYSEGTPQKSAYFIFSKNSTLVHQWNEAINVNIEFISRTFSKYFMEGFIAGVYPKCKEVEVQNADPDAYQTFGIQAMFAVIFIMFICFGISLLAFAAEHYIKWQAHVIRRKFQYRSALADPIHLMRIANAYPKNSDDKIQAMLNQYSRRTSENHSIKSDLSKLSICT